MATIGSGQLFGGDSADNDEAPYRSPYKYHDDGKSIKKDFE